MCYRGRVLAKLELAASLPPSLTRHYPGPTDEGGGAYPTLDMSLKCPPVSFAKDQGHQTGCPTHGTFAPFAHWWPLGAR